MTAETAGEATMEAERTAAEIARTTEEQKISLASQVGNLEEQVYRFRLRLLKAKEIQTATANELDDRNSQAHQPAPFREPNQPDAGDQHQEVKEKSGKGVDPGVQRNLGALRPHHHVHVGGFGGRLVLECNSLGLQRRLFRFRRVS